MIIAEEHKLMRLEKTINPLLDENDDKAFNYILQQVYCKWDTVLILQVVDECKSVPRSFPFHAAVDVRKVPNYAKIEQPIDLGTMGERCAGLFEIIFTWSIFANMVPLWTVQQSASVV